MLKQHIQFICCINCNFCGTLTLHKKGSLKETCGVKHKYFLTCLEKPTRIPTGDRISKMPCLLQEEEDGAIHLPSVMVLNHLAAALGFK